MARIHTQSGADIGINISNLMKLRTMLAKPTVIRTGIFAEDSGRTDEKSNVAIGKKHEYGNPENNLPVRSWLRLPLSLKKEDIAKTANKALAKGLKTGNFTDFYQKIAVECENIIVGAFHSDGYGQWTELSELTLSRKKGTQILRETDQLMNAVKSKVVST